MGLVGWSAIGLLGTMVSVWRGERNKVRQGVAWLLGVWVVYACVLVAVSLLQPRKTVAVGQPQCFDEMCFTVTGVEQVPGFRLREGQKLLRVRVQVNNHGRRAQSEKLIRAYLVDSEERRWEQTAGVNGVQLTARVAGGGSVVSEPVFQVPAEVTGLRLVFTHGWMQPGALVIGDSDSVLHQRTAVALAQ